MSYGELLTERLNDELLICIIEIIEYILKDDQSGIDSFNKMRLHRTAITKPLGKATKYTQGRCDDPV